MYSRTCAFFLLALAGAAQADPKVDAKVNKHGPLMRREKADNPRKLTIPEPPTKKSGIGLHSASLGKGQYDPEADYAVPGDNHDGKRSSEKRALLDVEVVRSTTLDFDSEYGFLSKRDMEEDLRVFQALGSTQIVQKLGKAVEDEQAYNATEHQLLDGYGHSSYKMDVDVYPSALDVLGAYSSETIVRSLTPIKTYLAKVRGKFAYATCLFPPPENYEGFKDKLQEKFFPMLHSRLADLEAGVDEFVLYTTADLAHEFTGYKFATIHVMDPHPELRLFRTAWRFLALNSEWYDYVAVVDADGDWKFAKHWKQELGNLKQWAITRLVPDMSCSNCNPPKFSSYATIGAGLILARPKLFDLNVTEAIGQYVALRKAREASSDPRITAPGEQHSVFNAPTGEHIYGWGNLMATYGFDEAFLKRVVYYYFANRGKLVSWNCQSGRRNPFQEAAVQADLDYVKSKGNYVHQGC